MHAQGICLLFRESRSQCGCDLSMELQLCLRQTRKSARVLIRQSRLGGTMGTLAPLCEADRIMNHDKKRRRLPRVGLVQGPSICII